MEELWKFIDGTSEMYKISNLGNVMVRDYRAKGYWREQVSFKVDHLGYRAVHIYYEGKRKAVLLHRLVAITFIPNPGNLPVVNHKDQNPANCRADNLEWCTVQYNATYADAVEKRRARITGVYRANDAVAQYTINGEFVAVHKSARDASYAVTGNRELKAETIVQVCRGARHLCCGYQWRYAFDGYPERLPHYCRTNMVEQLSLNGEHLAYYKSSYAAKDATGVQATQILKCCKGQRKQSGGFKWRYYDPDSKDE